MPSGRRQSATTTFRSEPSGRIEWMRLVLTSRTNRRPTAVLLSEVDFDLVTRFSFMSFSFASGLDPACSSRPRLCCGGRFSGPVEIRRAFLQKRCKRLLCVAGPGQYAVLLVLERHRSLD